MEALPQVHRLSTASTVPANFEEDSETGSVPPNKRGRSPVKSRPAREDPKQRAEMSQSPVKPGPASRPAQGDRKHRAESQSP